MSKPFDATTRKLIELGPAQWLAYLGIPVPDPSQIELIDSNLSTVTAEADRVVRIGGERPSLAHIELQANRDARLGERLQWYSVLLRYRHEIPVRTVVLLLRPAADGPGVDGTYEQRHDDGDVYAWFRYHVVRVWLQPVEQILAGGLLILPLAPVADVSLERLPDVLSAVALRLRQEASAEQAATLWKATEVLTGLRYTREQVGPILQRVSAMTLGIRGIEESWVYQDIFAEGRDEGRAEGRDEGRAEGRDEGRAEGRDEGRVEEARENLLRVGRKRLGEATEQVLAQISGMTDVNSLNLLLERALDVSSWDELLSPPDPLA